MAANKQLFAFTFEAMELQETRTGEYTIFIPSMNETYHSRNGAIAESRHVFINQGIAKTEGNIEVLEVGMGTGLNVLLTADYATTSTRKIRLHTLEPFPVPSELLSKLEYGKTVSIPSLFEAIHTAPWETNVKLTEYFTLYKTTQKLEFIALQKEKYDVILFDAFAPKKQEELWTEAIFRKLFSCLKSGGILTTYSAAGQLKRDLKSAGFSIENPPGANGKREMTVAVKK